MRFSLYHHCQLLKRTLLDIRYCLLQPITSAISLWLMAGCMGLDLLMYGGDTPSLGQTV
jgi:hypothetical protein